MLKSILVLLGLLGGLITAAPCRADDPPKQAKDLAGYWQGTLKAGAVSLRLVVNLKNQDGVPAATMDSPDENLTNLAINDLKIEDDLFSFKMKLTGAVYEGKLNEARTRIEGKWKQRGAVLPLTFIRLKEKPNFAKPQEPKRPFPYREEEVTFTNAKAKIKLAGTLTLPKGEGPFPAVMLITGSGPQDRDETILGHKPFLVLSDFLTRKGIAVLRADDRGVGKSTGKFTGSTTLDFVDDIKAGVAYLRTRKEIDQTRLGLIGHSEGGIIAPLVAAEDKDLAFIVLLAGPGLPGDDISNAQIMWLLRQAKIDEKTIAQRMQTQKKLMAAIKKFDDDDQTYQALEAILDEEIASLPEKDRKLGEAQKKKLLEGQLSKEGYAWTRFFARHDPRTVFPKVSCSVLAVIGEKDFQVSAKENLPELEKALKASGNKDYLVRELKGLNHLFQTCKTGGMEEYAKIEETLSPVLLKLLGEWIGRRVGFTK